MTRYRLSVPDTGISFEVDITPIHAPPPGPPGPGRWGVHDGRVVTPTGQPFAGAGMNVSVGMIDENGQGMPYIFEGLPYRGSGHGEGSVDIWHDRPNEHDGTLIFPGGPVTSIQRSSPEIGLVDLPDRAYGLNGVVSPAAAAAGVAARSDHWHQRWLRINCVTRAEDGPSPEITIPWYLDKMDELVDLDFVVVAADHALTGIGPDAPEWMWADADRLNDAIIDRFAGSENVWLSAPNEPWPGPPDREYRARMTRVIDRARDRGWDGLILIPLAHWGQDLAGAAAGDYDWVAGHSNVAIEWHAYGAHVGHGAYNHHTMNDHLVGCRERGLAVVVGEYGVTDPAEDAAGPYMWNRDAVECLATGIHGPALAVEHQLPIAAWHGCGDETYWHRFRLTSAPRPGLSLPVWDVTDPAAQLTGFGAAHWQISHDLW